MHLGVGVRVSGTKRARAPIAVVDAWSVPRPTPRVTVRGTHRRAGGGGFTYSPRIMAFFGATVPPNDRVSVSVEPGSTVCITHVRCRTQLHPFLTNHSTTVSESDHLHIQVARAAQAEAGMEAEAAVLSVEIDGATFPLGTVVDHLSVSI